MILGFGQYHTDLTKGFCNRIAGVVMGAENPEQEANRMAEELGTFKDKGWRIARIHRFAEITPYEGARVIVVEGSYSHYKDDHPMSPDGFASLVMPWCVTICIDDSWGERTYISV